MGRLALQDPASHALIDGWTTQPGMLGLRLALHGKYYRPWLTDGTADWIWPAAERAGIPIMVFMPGALDHLDRIAARHPNLKLVLDHVGLRIHRKSPQAFDDLPAVCALAKHPNLAVKASGLPALSTARYPFRDVQPHIRTLVEAFGPRRTFWGTDLTRMPCTYYECITLFTEHLPWLQGDDLAWVMGRGVCEWLGWSL